MHGLATAGSGFLLAVLWFDLMFDVQAWPYRRGEVPEAVLGSIAGYYRRVTTESRPMNRLVALAMLATLVAVVVEVARGTDPSWAGWASLVLIVVPVGVAGSRTVPSAVRLGGRTDLLPRQSELAVAILGQHLFCLVCIAALLAVQVASSA